MTQTSSGYERKDQNLYETPAWVTDAPMGTLSDRLPRGWSVWEPCAGNGKMVSAIEKAGYRVFASDYVSRPSLNAVGDIRELSTPIGTSAIITNPPYGVGLTESIIADAIEKMRPCRGLVAMLLKVDYDSGKSDRRRQLFEGCEAFAGKLVLRGRINWFPLKRRSDGSVGPGSSDNHAWFVWDWETINQRPIIGYLDKPEGVDEVEPLREVA
jgi:hypothetical protein